MDTINYVTLAITTATTMTTTMPIITSVAKLAMTSTTSNKTMHGNKILCIKPIHKWTTHTKNTYGLHYYPNHRSVQIAKWTSSVWLMNHTNNKQKVVHHLGNRIYYCKWLWIKLTNLTLLCNIVKQNSILKQKRYRLVMRNKY